MSITSNIKTRSLALLAGALFGLSFPRFGIVGGFAAFVALVPLLIALEDTKRLRDAFSTTYLMMFVVTLIATYWVGGWKGEGQVDPFLMVGGVALALVHPLFLVIPVLVYDAARRRFGRISALIVLPIVWVGFEYWHSTGDLSFPWLSLFNTQTYNTAYIQFIEFTGSYGLSLVIVIINILIYSLLRQRKILGLAPTVALKTVGAWKRTRLFLVSALAALIILPYCFGLYQLSHTSNTTEPTRAIRVAIIQPNINPWDKWASGTNQITDSMFRTTRTALATSMKRPDLALWPETAITYPITQPWRKEDLRNMYSFVSQIGMPVLTGIPDREEYIRGQDTIPTDAKKSNDPALFYRDWNSSMLFYFDLSGKPTYQRYHKQMLVPFGEHVPYVDQFPILGEWFKWGVGLGSWNRGEGYEVFKLLFHGQQITQPDTAKLCTMVCYESVYPSYVRKFVANGADLITIITNDGWYGNSSGPYQHNRFAVLRAIENRRWVARSANTGISSVIDDKGRFIEETAVFKSASIIKNIPLITTQTLYTQYGDVIALPSFWFTAILIVVLITMRLLSKKKKHDAV